MRLPLVDDTVKLRQDIPELMLLRGMSGVVRSTWCAPWQAYEVEFRIEGNTYDTRALLMAEQVEVYDSAESLDSSSEFQDSALV